METDILFGNAEEYMAWAKVNIKAKIVTPIEAARHLFAFLNKNILIIMHDGANPIHILSKNSKSNGIHEESFSVPEVGTVIDSTGAGDTFVGGFLASLVMNPTSPLSTHVDTGIQMA
jgi:sugar/nucleoside kinase (ribokinase family)